jgi:signal transduction histidine kinase
MSVEMNRQSAFFRGDERSEGAGLGLYIVQAITDKLKGSVEVFETGHNGTSIRLVLPDMKGVD